MFRFAVRVIVKAGELGAATDAKATLARWHRANLAPNDMSDELAWGIRRLGGRPEQLKTRSRSVARPTAVYPSDRLIVGQVYKRRDLHRAGWGATGRVGSAIPPTATMSLCFRILRQRANAVTTTAGSVRGRTPITGLGTDREIWSSRASTTRSWSGARTSCFWFGAAMVGGLRATSRVSSTNTNVRSTMAPEYVALVFQLEPVG